MKSFRLKAAVAALGLIGLVGCEADNESNIKTKGSSAGKPVAGAAKTSEEAAKAAQANSPMNSDPAYLNKGK